MDSLYKGILIRKSEEDIISFLKDNLFGVLCNYELLIEKFKKEHKSNYLKILIDEVIGESSIDFSKFKYIINNYSGTHNINDVDLNLMKTMLEFSFEQDDIIHIFDYFIENDFKLCNHSFNIISNYLNYFYESVITNVQILNIKTKK